MHPLPLTIAATTVDEIAELELVGEIDLSSAHLLVDEIDAAIEAGARTVVLDFAGVSFVNSTGLGAMVAIELFENGDLSRPDAALTKQVVAEAARRGLILLSCGTYGNVIRILVPLTASDELLLEGLAILADSLEVVAAATN